MGEQGLETRIILILCSDVKPNACHGVVHPSLELLYARIYICLLSDDVMWP